MQFLFARFRQELETRIGLRFAHGDGLTMLRGPAGKTFAQQQMRAPDRIAGQSGGSAQPQNVAVGFQQIDRAGVDLHHLFGAARDQIERGVQIPRRRQRLRDLAQAGHGARQTEIVVSVKFAGGHARIVMRNA